MLSALLLLIAAPADSFTGRVTTITDGDSIKVLHERTEITIRLEGIDCPEAGQAFGAKAKQATSEFCFGKTVTVHATGTDRYGRTLANVVLPDGKLLNQELVRSGYAWWFRKYSDDETLKTLEAGARENKLGLWADPQPIAPWDWRAAQTSRSVLPSREIEIVPNGVAIISLLPNPAGQDAGREQVTLRNSTAEAVDLTAWKLMDKAGNVYLLAGRIEPGEDLIVTMAKSTMPLNNDGDSVSLVDADGVGRSRVVYSGAQARVGAVVRFGE